MRCLFKACVFAARASRLRVNDQQLSEGGAIVGYHPTIAHPQTLSLDYFQNIY